ncbi:MAG: hypothetical protein NT176_01560 [Proteobacteria bacterium]|nr:hypothetical protein [Pseudomonadota bacterium]
MTTLNTARTLARYNAWADKLVFEAVAALPPDSSALIVAQRGAQQVQVKVQVGERPRDPGAER